MKTKIKLRSISKAVYCKQFCVNCGGIRRHIVIRNPTGLDTWKCCACKIVKKMTF